MVKKELMRKTTCGKNVDGLGISGVDRWRMK
jgi:hypothetical protein